MVHSLLYYCVQCLVPTVVDSGSLLLYLYTHNTCACIKITWTCDDTHSYVLIFIQQSAEILICFHFFYFPKGRKFKFCLFENRHFFDVVCFHAKLFLFSPTQPTKKTEPLCFCHTFTCRTVQANRFLFHFRTQQSAAKRVQEYKFYRLMYHTRNIHISLSIWVHQFHLLL